MSPPPRSAAGAPSRSAVVGAAATGRHLLEIEGYSHTKQQLPTGRGVQIHRPFTVGEFSYSWLLTYYPNGDAAEFADFVSVSITHQSKRGPGNLRNTAEEVDVRVTLSLLDQAGDPVLSQTKTTALYKFTVYDVSDDAGAGGIAFHDFIDRAWLEGSEHLSGDRFTVSCDVVVPLEVRTEEKLGAPRRPAAAPFVVVPPSDLHRHLGGLRVDEEGADVTFRVAGETFRAHRCVLAARSTVFRAELFGPMKEEEISDDTTCAIIRVDDMEAQVFRALLAFVYTDALPDAPNMKQQEEAAMLQHLLVAADRYNLKRLKLICQDKLCKHINTGSAATILALAEQQSCHGLKKACLQFVTNPATLNDVVATDGFEHLARSCPSVLREIICSVSARAPVEHREAFPSEKQHREARRDGNEKDILAPTTLPPEYLAMLRRQGMISSGETSYWGQVIVLVILCGALYLNGGNALISCICLLVAAYVGTTIY